MKVLFIGGTGNLSSACTEIAINKVPVSMLVSAKKLRLK